MITPKRYLILTSLYIILSYSVFVVTVSMGKVRILSDLTGEDDLFEAIGAWGFFIAGILFIAAFFRSKQAEADAGLAKRLAYLVLAAIFLFGAGEEMSWGQRIFDIETPEAISEISLQDEINLHNLHVFGIGAAALLRRIFNLFWLIFVVVIPVTSTIYEPVRRRLEKYMPVIPWWLGLPFLLNYLVLRVILIAARFLIDIPPSSSRYLFRAGEIQESNWALLFAVVAFYVACVMLKSPSAELSAGSRPPTSS